MSSVPLLVRVVLSGMVRLEPFGTVNVEPLEIFKSSGRLELPYTVPSVPSKITPPVSIPDFSPLFVLLPPPPMGTPLLPVAAKTTVFPLITMVPALPPEPSSVPPPPIPAPFASPVAVTTPPVMLMLPPPPPSLLTIPPPPPIPAPLSLPVALTVPPLMVMVPPERR